MARRRKPDPAQFLGSLEARVMEDLWRRGESSVGDVLERLNSRGRRELAYNTVMSVMARLERKGFLSRERRGKAFFYRPVMDRDEFVAHQASQAAGQLLDEFGDVAVVGLVDELRDRPELRQQLQRLLSEVEATEP